MHYQLDLQFQFLAKLRVEAFAVAVESGSAQSDPSAGGGRRDSPWGQVILAARAGPGLPRQTDLGGPLYLILYSNISFVYIISYYNYTVGPW